MIIRSIDLLQAIIIICFWYRHAKNLVHFAIDRFINLAVDVAIEIGISKQDCPMGVASVLSEGSEQYIISADAWRTWVLCYLLSASLGSCMRIPSRVIWDPELEMKLSSLEYGAHRLKSDNLLCQIIRAERLCQQITEEAGYDSSDSILEVTDHTKIRRLQNLIIDRKAQVFSSLSCPGLKLYEHIATMFLHECILHTPTNKRSFAAPFVVERLSLTDFPAPIVTPDHIPFIYGLRDACHAALETFLTFEAATIVAAPLVIFTAKAFYAQWLLIKLYVAVTAQDNTYGAFIDVQTLNLETYLEKMGDLGDAVSRIDEPHMAGKMLQSSRKLREWVWNYKSLLAEEPFRNSSPLNPTSINLDNVAFENSDSIDWVAFDYSTNVFGYGLEDMFSIEQPLIGHI